MSRILIWDSRFSANHLILFAFFALLLGFKPAKAEELALNGHAITVTGDTLYIESVDKRVRIWGLDAPQMSTPEGMNSRATMARLLRHCNPIKCSPTGQTEDGTVVARCLDFYGKDLTALMIKAGAGAERKGETRTAEAAFPDVWKLYDEARTQQRQ